MYICIQHTPLYVYKYIKVESNQENLCKESKFMLQKLKLIHNQIIRHVERKR